MGLVLAGGGRSAWLPRLAWRTEPAMVVVLEGEGDWVGDCDGPGVRSWRWSGGWVELLLPFLNILPQVYKTLLHKSIFQWRYNKKQEDPLKSLDNTFQIP